MAICLAEVKSGIRNFLHYFRKNTLVSNFFALYGIQLAVLVLPIVTLPFIARKLGPDNLGHFAVVQALSLSLYVIVEYGFSFSATRYVAENSALKGLISEFSSGVLCAKAFLSAVVIFIAFVIYLLSVRFQSDPKLFASGILYAIVQGLSPLWFFQGVGRMTKIAIIDAVARASGTLAIFIVLRYQNQAWLIMSLQSLFIFMGYVIAYYMLAKEVALRFVSIKDTMSVLKNNFSLFLFRLISSFINTGNSIVLSVFASPSQVAYFYNADKLSVGARSFMIPINQLVFPRISQAISYDIGLAKRLFRRSLAIMLLLSLLIAVCLFFFGPNLIILFLGKEYAPSIRLFQIIVLATPLFAMGNALGMQWMIPNRFDITYNVIVCCAAIIGFTVIICLTPTFKALGIIIGFISSELFICFAIIFFLRKKVQNPFSDLRGPA